MNIREELINDLIGEAGKLQYDENDEGKIKETAESVTSATVMMIEALGNYAKTAAMEVDENAADLMKSARYDLVHAWASLQGATSRIAHTFRVDADEAFKRVVQAYKDDVAPELAGL